MKKTTATIAQRAKRRNLLGEGILDVRLSSESYCEPLNDGAIRVEDEASDIVSSGRFGVSKCFDCVGDGSHG